MRTGLIFHALRDATAERTTLDAARGAQVPVARWPREADGWAIPEALRAAGGVVWDLDGGRRGALPVLHQLRAVRPALPVLLYLPLRPGTMTVAGEAAMSVPGVTTLGQWLTTHDLESLAAFMRRAAASSPIHKTLEVILDRATTDDGPVPAFARAVLQRLIADRPVTVGAICRDLQLSERRLRWAWSKTRYPQPHELAAWIELVLLAVTGAADGRSPNEVARGFGHDERSFATLRRRLGTPPLATQTPREALESVLAAYRTRAAARPRPANLPLEA